MNGFAADVLANILGAIPVLGLLLWVIWWRLNGLEQRANDRWATHHKQHTYVQETLSKHTGEIGELKGKAGI